MATAGVSATREQVDASQVAATAARDVAKAADATAATAQAAAAAAASKDAVAVQAAADAAAAAETATAEHEAAADAAAAAAEDLRFGGCGDKFRAFWSFSAVFKGFERFWIFLDFLVRFRTFLHVWSYFYPRNYLYNRSVKKKQATVT